MYKAIFINLLYISCILQNYKIKFGYSQVLFMGSVPRINRPLAIVSWANNIYLRVLCLKIRNYITSKLSLPRIIIN